jgi:transcriptional regulator
MYVPDHFAADEAQTAAMLAQAGFGALVTHGPEGLFATHMPFLHDAESGALRGHVARANPHAALAIEGEALVIFQGPDAYVSPSWYPSKASDPRVVPTWNYEAVHVYGTLTWRNDADWIVGNVTALTERFEAGRREPWSVSDAPEDYVRRLVRGVIGVEVRISRVEAKRKLSQNRPAADRQGVIDGLAAAGDADKVAAAMRSLQI